MSNESNPDEFVAWRRRLQQPDALPGHGLADKGAAWDKVFSRLGERPRRQFWSFRLYRIAAACILISLIPASRLFEGRPASGRTQPAGMQQPSAVQRITPIAVTPAALPAVTPAQPSVVAASPGKTRQPAAGNPKRSASRPPSPLSVRAADPAWTLLASDGGVLTSRSIIPPPVLSTTSVPLVTPGAGKAAPKKEWKVVDFNEIEPVRQRPRESFDRMATNRQPRIIRLGIGNGLDVDEATPQHRDNDTHFKINLTTQNH